MAYRQLCSVSFALLGLVVVGCGGGTGSSTGTGSPTASDQPRANSDQPISNSDRALTSADQPPSNADVLPSVADATSVSGGFGALCERFCGSLAGLADGCPGLSGLNDVCSGASRCQIPAADVACETQAGELLDCASSNLQSLCAAGQQNDTPGNGDQQPAAAQPAVCSDVLKAFTNCVDAHQPTDGGKQPPGPDCTQGTDCTKCICNAAGDQAKIQACADVCIPATP